MRTYLILLALIGFSYSSLGQSYYYVINQGVTDDYYPFGTPVNPILSDPANDVFSSPQTIPFPWDFYGSPVTQFIASDNGYITFDLGAAVSDPNNGSIPTPGGPNNAIYAFWDNLELSNNPAFSRNDISSFIVGSAPNRVFTILWHATPLGQTANGNYLYFALRLYEQGDFDVIFPQIRLNAGVTISATVGCEDSSGTDGTMAANSPFFTYTGGAYIKENVKVYSFYFGSQPNEDILMVSLDMDDPVSSVSTYQVKGSLINHGAQTIDSLELNYTVDGGAVQNALMTGLSLAPHATYNFTHPTNWTPTNIGNFEEVTVYVSAINGNPDANPENDSLTHSAFVNEGAGAIKKVLLEEFSTAPCGWCPRGHLLMEELLGSYPNLVGLTHHSGYQSDSMTISESVVIAGEFASGAPSGCIDRILWPLEIKIAVSTADWEGHIQSQLLETAPVDINISHSWHWQTRVLGVTIDLNFMDYTSPGDMRLNVFVIEDSVVGNGVGWDQYNYYNDDPTHPYYQAGHPIEDYVHRHVIRASLTGDWGDKTLIPTNVLPGEQYNATYTYIIPYDYKQKDISLVAFVALYDGIDRQILNANNNNNLKLGVGAIQNEGGNLSIYPNPFSSYLNITFENPYRSLYTYRLVDVMGKTVLKGRTSESHLQLNRANMAPGIYLIELEGENLMRAKVIAD